MKIKAFTLIEMIISIVILGILSAGTFVSIKHLYLRVTKSKALSELSLDSQIMVDQISALLYTRVASSVIGSVDHNGDNFQSIYAIDHNFTILEWIGTASEALKVGNYSGFVDLDASDRNSDTLISYGMNSTELNTTEFKKFSIPYNYNTPNDSNVTALIFAGSFDDGSMLADFNNSFGWHGKNHVLIYDITNITDDNISLAVRPDEIYEKYYLVDSAYAIARKEDIILPCSGVLTNDANVTNTLFLFYNYRPWKGENFCNGDVTILSKEVKGFEVGLINDSIYFNLTLVRDIRGSDNNVTISKQKVIF